MGKFQVKKTAKGGLLFNLLATNGQVVATSEVYNSRASLLKGIASVSKNAPIAGIEDQTAGDAALKNPKFEIYADKAGKTRFRLKAKNGQIIAVGEAYETKRAALAGVASVQKNAPDAEITEA